MLAGSSKRSMWWAGTATLGVAKIIENMEIGHNVMHGQWDWMNDPEIHSSTWEWDMSGASKHWRFTHNFMHHKYTNILGMDDDVGYGVLRVTRDRGGSRSTWATCSSTPFSRSASSGASGCSTWSSARSSRAATTAAATMVRVREFGVKAGHQVVKDYVAYPGADVAVARRDVHVHAQGQRGRQRDPQRLVQRGDLLRPFP